MQTSYKFSKEVSYSFEEALKKVQEELHKEGFGILTDIDVQATLKKKLDEDTLPYRILGACNPKLAHQALEAEPSIGVLLPCNVTVRISPTNKVIVEFMDPYGVLSLINNPKVDAIGKEVREKMQRVKDRL